MNPFGVLVVPEIILCALMGATWWWVLRQPTVSVGWRHIASVAGLVLPTLTLFLELLLAAIVAHYGSLHGLDDAAAHGGWSSVIGHLSLGLSFAAGLLPLCGLVLAMIGKGSPRVLAAIWSCAALGTFFANFVLAVNSFH